MLRNQFYSLPQPDPKEFVVFADRSNASKNRYSSKWRECHFWGTPNQRSCIRYCGAHSDIPCLDATRILLEFLLFEDGGGYIHANRVTYPLLRNDFILTQASSLLLSLRPWIVVTHMLTYYKLCQSVLILIAGYILATLCGKGFPFRVRWLEQYLNSGEWFGRRKPKP